ncbi:MAG: ThuA domain-containing protein [Clostridia bacterium]|nr:ThuA domain-containing protein [Clostridia bacterium]
MAGRVLALGTRVNAPYHPFENAEARFMDILRDVCDLECGDDPGALSDPRGWAGVLSYLDEWKEKPRAEWAAGLTRFVAEGGGLLLLHNGICVQSDPLIEEMIGGRFLNHPAQEEITFTPGGLLQDCRPFTVKEEPYRFALKDPGEMILTYDQGGETYPAGWRRTYGKGRVAYLCPGHTGEIFDIPAYRDMIRKCMRWCLGEDIGCSPRCRDGMA